jgi:hypothetical protein
MSLIDDASIFHRVPSGVDRDFDGHRAMLVECNNDDIVSMSLLFNNDSDANESCGLEVQRI